MIKGKVALVTGASKGIGKAIAEALAGEGVKVGLFARGKEELRQLETSLNKPGSERMALALTGDVTQYNDLAAAVGKLEAEFGGLDFLINNAGIGLFKPVHQFDLGEWRTVIETNLTGPFYATKAVVPALERRGGGHIVNIGSLASKNAFTGGAAYNASKFGLLGLSEASMLDLRYLNIRVSSVLPGSVDTEFAANTQGADWKIQAKDVAEAVVYQLKSDPRIVPGQLEIRPAKPPKK
ncbi:MAG: SDR family oxidoreductase [Deinococcus sp.]|nr:SDR family oxidoreductase [Deinococcus sp.]MCL5965440.1 SDR family oxidoreductase [Deinococcus sp.]